MAALSFAVTYDYRCPFARNVHEHVLDGLAAGADWEVTFVPFSLSQAKAEAGETWERRTDSGLAALELGVAVRDTQPDQFPAVHRALFALRHDHGGDLRDEEALRGVLVAEGADADAAFAEVASGGALERVRKEHEAASRHHDVWGVPTFVAADRAAFVRLMNRPGGDGGAARDRVERLVALLREWPDLNEFKHTSLPH